MSIIQCIFVCCAMLSESFGRQCNWLSSIRWVACSQLCDYK